jgi:hypothetical protein
VNAGIRELEERLLDPAVRASAEEVGLLLADDFLEFGSSGRVFDKGQVIEGLAANPGEGVSVERFEERVLGPGVVLVTYRSVRAGDCQHALRSSIWRLEGDRWRMVFHQGTPVEPGVL